MNEGLYTGHFPTAETKYGTYNLKEEKHTVIDFFR